MSFTLVWSFRVTLYRTIKFFIIMKPMKKITNESWKIYLCCHINDCQFFSEIKKLLRENGQKLAIYGNYLICNYFCAFSRIWFNVIFMFFVWCSTPDVTICMRRDNVNSPWLKLWALFSGEYLLYHRWSGFAQEKSRFLAVKTQLISGRIFLRLGVIFLRLAVIPPIPPLVWRKTPMRRYCRTSIENWDWRPLFFNKKSLFPPISYKKPPVSF